MTYDENQVAKIVETVVNKIRAYQIYPGLESIPMSDGGGVFQGIEEAIDAAEAAYHSLMDLSLETRKDIIQSMREMAIKHSRYLAELAVQETGLGRLT
jgi:propionaldehyde dehydrogenase